jgi:hypothetical protein
LSQVECPKVMRLGVLIFFERLVNILFLDGKIP